jgi:hypothetical protein
MERVGDQSASMASQEGQENVQLPLLRSLGSLVFNHSERMNSRNSN